MHTVNKILEFILGEAVAHNFQGKRDFWHKFSNIHDYSNTVILLFGVSGPKVVGLNIHLLF